MNKPKKYVVLEHLCLPDRGLRFYSTNSDNNTHSFSGELWYKEVGFVDTSEEAQALIAQWDPSKLPTFRELEEYYKQQIKEAQS